MDKVFKVVGTDGLPRTSNMQSITDWNECVLCQEITAERFVCPAHSTKGAGYATMAENLLAFNKMGCLPTTLPMSTR